jgi:hypothetical protein
VRVLHPERLEDALAQETVQRHSRRALDDHAEHVDRVPVDPTLARLRVERQGGHARDRGGDRLVAVREVPPLNPRRLPAIARGALAVAEAGGVGEQIPDRDGTLRRDDVVAAAGARHGDRRLLELGDVVAHRVREQQRPLLLEHQRRDAHHGLRLRGDAEDRVVPHRGVRLAIALADGAEERDPAVPGDQHDRAGQPAVVHVRLQGRAEPLEPGRREPDLLGRGPGERPGRREDRQDEERDEQRRAPGTKAG